MKWNAIITKKQYQNALIRMEETGQELAGHDDERALLRLLIRDYEDRNLRGPDRPVQGVSVIGNRDSPFR